jgi:hypothetical protein
MRNNPRIAARIRDSFASFFAVWERRLEMRKRQGFLLLAVVMLAGFLAGCQEKHDTRQYVDTIGFVLSNQADTVIDEMYVYPNEDGTVDTFASKMGKNLIKNKGTQRKVGSFGVTLELYQGYNILVRNRGGGVYHFENIHLQDADHGVLTFDYERDLPNLELNHWSGGIETVQGRYVPPDDAPDHTQTPLRKTINYKFEITNDTDVTFNRVTMREAEYPDEGEVELYIEPIEPGRSVSATGWLYEEDQDITAWRLYVETQNGEIISFSEPFDVWTQSKIIISGSGSVLSYAALS